MSLNIFEKALLEGLTSEESDTLLQSTYKYNVPSSPGSTTQMNPRNFLPVLQGYNPYDEKNPTSKLVPYGYDSSGIIKFDPTKTLYMFSIKSFNTTESISLNDTFFNESIISDDLIFDSNANIYSYKVYSKAWNDYKDNPVNNIDNIVKSIEKNDNFSFFNPLLNSQPTPTYQIDHSNDNNKKTTQTLYTQITPAQPGDRQNNETVNKIEQMYTSHFQNFGYLPKDLTIYPIYIPSMFFQYFLYKENIDGNWHIIYNPVHRQNYFNYWTQNNSPKQIGNNITNMHMINYGNIFKTVVSDGSSYFIDPVCTCVTPLLIKYPKSTNKNVKPNYVGPYIYNPNNPSTDDNLIKDYYNIYNILLGRNKYSYTIPKNIVLERSFYDNAYNNQNISLCYSSCFNNIAPIIDSKEPYTYTFPIISLIYYRNKKDTYTTQDVLPLWGKMSFINYVNGRAYTNNNSNKDNQETYICNKTEIKNQICETIFSGAGSVDVKSSQINIKCGQDGGGAPPVDQDGGKTDQDGGKTGYNNTGVPGSLYSNKNNTIIIIIISSFLGICFIILFGFYIYNKSKNKSINQKII